MSPMISNSNNKDKTLMILAKKLKMREKTFKIKKIY